MWRPVDMDGRSAVSRFHLLSEYRGADPSGKLQQIQQQLLQVSVNSKRHDACADILLRKFWCFVFVRGVLQRLPAADGSALCHQYLCRFRRVLRGGILGGTAGCIHKRSQKFRWVPALPFVRLYNFFLLLKYQQQPQYRFSIKGPAATYNHFHCELLCLMKNNIIENKLIIKKDWSLFYSHSILFMIMKKKNMFNPLHLASDCFFFVTFEKSSLQRKWQWLW